jgi:DNA-binding transcriptional ArsR family regulator
MAIPAALQPTLWRTCRVLANHKRLEIIGLLADQSPQTVSSVALRLKLALPVTSQYLRALEARGLLTSQRAGRRVSYRLSGAASDQGQTLVTALKSELRRGSPAMENVFKLATAFTHPRRIEIFRSLQITPLTLSQVHTVTRISVPALLRHIAKLEARGFVTCRLGTYTTTEPSGVFGGALARLAAG